ncbi:hypothetical protein [Fibrobacter sp. UWB10]|uniref:hypothetical protein n=1 Tax=Fibrobacter sp. UWB10 TaxID=1896201 RepID=UPI0024030BF1|nr:hypothetical protein [Fibrobacter sp. UWB10]SMP57883.1 hypothetical protein SAMN05720465_2786 [Fibrobacter sp. UWB10]
MTFTPDTSGILSLFGFSYQIKVFCSLAAKLTEGQQIEFESFDDIATNKSIDPNFFDKNINGQIKSPSYQSIQVKHTKITNQVAENVLLNWIQIEESTYNIKEYILITDKKDQSTDLITAIDKDCFINKVMNSQKKTNANITKVKKIFEKKTNLERKNIISSILGKYTFSSIDINADLKANFGNLFQEAANHVLYEQRLDEFLTKITCKVLESINSLKPYTLSHEEFQKYINEVLDRFSLSQSLPSYNNYRLVHPIDLNDTKIANSREYKQLQYCTSNKNVLRNYLLNKQYYNKIRNYYIDACMESKCGDIEITAYENFERVKSDLQEQDMDTPKNRLKETTQAPNIDAQNNQIRDGVCIYLTGDSIPEDTQISWKDD